MAPDNYRSHIALGLFYSNTGQYSKAIAPFEQAMRLKPENIDNLWNLVGTCQGANDQEKLVQWASHAVPYFERHLKLHPDEELQRVMHALLLQFANRKEEAREAAKALDNIRDGNSLYNTACLWSWLGDFEMAFKTFRKSIEAGFRNLPKIKEFIEDDINASFKDMHEYEEVKGIVEKLSEP